MAAIGVILHPSGSHTEELLGAFAEELRDRGVRVGGLYQRSGTDPNGKSRMELVDIAEGKVYLISQNLGRFSQACCVDPGGLADASMVLRRDMERGLDLLIINKFARHESLGRGLTAELFEAVSRGIPVLTAVSHRYKAAWDELTDCAGDILAADPDALRSWWAKVQKEAPRP
ncbi:DUF2478 domain-containing protein [Telmatospirillum sp. J64-1]|uniref:DUF2478 domain-containing protein n=1 Tax=Telmatospirillum sp. J64-1 TaxID=2502183 RepID=UPI00163D6FFD|nr:DUF2478 domain-containing protein [Telmatospirillum sp. J64-1]